jgi:hypothetical protein
MDIENTLNEIEELIKNMGGMQLALPKLPKPVSPITTPKQPTTAPVTTKNPVKVAQQIQDPSTKQDAVKQAKTLLKYNSFGQWAIDGE